MRFPAVIVVAILTSACVPGAPPVVNPAAASRSSSVTADLDKTVRACDDFYRFANGAFLQNNPIPPAFSRWGRFEMLREQNRTMLRSILDAAAATRTTSPDPDVRRLGAFYASCMDTSAVERNGLAAVRPILDRIDTIASPADVAATIGSLHGQGLAGSGFGFSGASDLHEPMRMMADVAAGGVGLPERGYYVNDDAKSQEIRQAYVKHIAEMLRLSGVDSGAASRDAEGVLALETALARGSFSRAELRNPDVLDNPMSLDALQRMTPHFDWSQYAGAVRAPQFSRVNVEEPDFLKVFDRQLETQPVDVWRSYLRWSVLNQLAPALPNAFVAQNFRFYGQTLSGRHEEFPRWRQCIDATDGFMGDALGRLYVERVFPPPAKVHAQKMIDNLTAALREGLGDLQWMSAVTREQAAQKLARYSVQVGYPTKWRDYSALHIDDSPYATNFIRAADFVNHHEVAKIDTARDATEWTLNPYEVNAYNSPTLNSIRFPAGILQPPLFDPNGDDAYNYGGMGSIIGHEIIHGFDDEGRRFDAYGKLRDWWQPEDSRGFDERASCVERQFSSYTVGDVHVNGKLVLGESIADLGGLKIAYAAYERSLEGKSRATVDGFTPEQRFFLGWARAWAVNGTAEADRLQTTSNEHPLARFRVNGPLSNMPEFRAAFHCGDGSTMVRADRCSIW